MEKPRLIPADYLRNNPFAETHKYKIYHDGYNYVATRIVRSKGKRPPKDLHRQLSILLSTVCISKRNARGLQATKWWIIYKRDS